METSRFKLPLLSASQAQKHVTVNEALTMLDLLVGVIPVASRALTTPGGAEPDGTVMILGGTGTGGWAGFAAFDVALKIDGNWRRVLPTTAMIASVANEGGKLVYYSGAAWIDVVTEQSGTWMPGITFGGAAVGVTYGPNTSGRYTKIGKLVTASFLLHVSNKGSSVGAAMVTGLPFLSVSSPILGTLALGWATSVGASGTIIGTVGSNSQTISLYASTSGTASALTNTVFSASGFSQIMGTAIYEAAA